MNQEASHPTSAPAHIFLLCPGQGAQHVGMGRAWCDASEPARQTFEQAQAILGLDLRQICFEGPEAELNRTDIAQAAIYVTSVACFRALVERGELDPAQVVATAGLSLGEFTALHLAGVFSFEDGLKLVRLRGQAMQDAAQAQPSTMVAITGDVSEERINELCDQARGDGILVPANFNSPMQVVVSGSVEACERAVAVAQQMGFKPTPLTVAGAFHSPIMAPAAERLAAALEQVTWRNPARITVQGVDAGTMNVLANVTAQPHDLTDPPTISQLLVQQLTNPVRWSQSMQWAAANVPAQFVELAPGKVLAGLMRRIDRTMKVVNHAEPSN